MHFLYLNIVETMFFKILTDPQYKYLTFFTLKLLAKKIFKEIITDFVRKKDALFFTFTGKISGAKILTNFVIFFLENETRWIELQYSAEKSLKN
jgi:hypothetical protein